MQCMVLLNGGLYIINQKAVNYEISIVLVKAKQKCYLLALTTLPAATVSRGTFSNDFR